MTTTAQAQRPLATGPALEIMELAFAGPEAGPADQPTVKIHFTVTFRHEGGEERRIHGYWDGDGSGGDHARGDQSEDQAHPGG